MRPTVDEHAPPRIRLLIVDDHDILRYGIRSLLRGHGEIEVVGEADSMAQAIAQAATLSPDVILMDARLPDGSGVDACRQILSVDPAKRVLFFSGYADRETILLTVLAGAHGYVSKDVDLSTLVDGIRTVARGGSVTDEGVKAEVLSHLASTTSAARLRSAGTEPLSPQEERVMGLVVLGKTNKEIAAALGLSDKTVKNYLYNAFQKLGVGRRAHAASLFGTQRLEGVSGGPRASLKARKDKAPEKPQ